MNRMTSVQDRVASCAMMEPHRLFRELDISENGMSEADAERYREYYGANQTVGKNKDTIWYRLRRAFVNPFSVVLFLLAVLSFFTDVVFVSNFSRNVTTVILILFMLLLSGIVRFVQDVRAKRVTDRLVLLVHTTVQVKRDGRWQERPSEDLVVGDMVRLDAGDRVPADIRLIQARDFFVSQSGITGESGILEKTADALTHSPVRAGDYYNTVFLGTTVTGGSCEGVVLAVGQNTMYGGISPNVNRRKNGFDQGENSIARVLIKFMALLVPIVFVACGLTQGNWLEAFLFALSVAVGLTPELLPMVLTACLARGTNQMGQKQTVVKSINAMEGFGSMDVLCVDKTGTLTGDMVTLEYFMDVLGNECEETLDCALLNSYYHTGISNHLDAAILKMREMPGREEYFTSLLKTHQKLDELPFDYNRKVASVLLKEEESNALLVKGSIKEVVRRCRYVMYRGERREIGEDREESVRAVAEEMLEDGMKMLAVAGRRLDKEVVAPEDECELTLIGYLAFFDAPRQDASDALKRLQDLRIGVKILTGDHRDVAASVCRRLGIPAERVMTGEELDALSDNELPVLIERESIFAELSPRQKAFVVEMLQENGHTVGFLGDGMNDLPAVFQADVGISVDTAIDAVKESADVILLKKDLNVLEEGVVEGRKAFANMSKYIKITASSNFGNICAIVAASVLLPFYPMTSVQLLLLTLLYDLLCLVLPWDNVDGELYEKPREWSGRTLGRFMIFFGPISSVFDILTFAFLFFVLCPGLCGGSYRLLDPAEQAYFVALFQTGWFLESMWTQVLILHLLRTRQIPFIQSRPSRPVVWTTILGILVLTVLIVTPAASALGLTTMPPGYIVFLIVTVVLYLIVVTLGKQLYIRKHQELI